MRKKHCSLKKELTLYALTGIFTTAINLIVYFECLKFIPPAASNVCGWFCCTLFAYITSSRLVFGAGGNEFSKKLKQCASFFAVRFVSGFIETVAVYIFIQKMNLNDLAVKLASGVFVVIFNYLFSKVMIFKKS